MDGMICIRKEKGYTSHDVVAKLRGILKQKKIGHTGTLDPDAEGVLPVALGAATKLCELFSDRSKTYVATVRLGIATDTEDMTGTVVEENDFYKELSEADIENAVKSFIGDYDQVPPMYSALKVDGHKLYEYARKGVEIERQARRLKIYDIKLLWVNLPSFGIEVSCSKGTYIRTLSKDIGLKLGGPSCMEALLRNRVGDFRLEDALTLSRVEELVREDRVAEYIYPVEDNFKFLPAMIVSIEGKKQLENGNPISKGFVSKHLESDGECNILGDWESCVRIYDWNKEFIGVYRLVTDCYKAEKLFFLHKYESE